MVYEEQHLRNWLKQHPLISINALEKEAQLPKDTVNHFVNERRGFPKKHYEKLLPILFDYGYQEITAE